MTENRAPAAPPPGFTAVEAVSWKVNLAEGAQGVALSKIDFILNPGSEFPHNFSIVVTYSIL